MRWKFRTGLLNGILRVSLVDGVRSKLVIVNFAIYQGSNFGPLWFYCTQVITLKNNFALNEADLTLMTEASKPGIGMSQS